MTKPTKRQHTTRRKRATSKADSRAAIKKNVSLKEGVGGAWQRLMQRRQAFLRRRPHRSFRVTKRRDYRRSLKLPGYFALTKQAWQLMRQHWRIFVGLAAIYAVLGVLLSGLMSQDTYQQLKDTINEANQEGALGAVMPTLALFAGVVTNQLGGSTGGVGSSQQLVGALIGLYIWLTTIWLIRGVTADKRLKIRDGLYNAGAPVIALAVLVFIALIQLLPAAIAVIIYGAADTSGMLQQTVVLMLAAGATILIVTLSIYWLTSTLFAMVIVTLPGMYPLEAARLASDVVLGRRMRILLRLMWLLVVLAVVWAAVLIPVITIDGALKTVIPALNWLPLVPLVALLLVAFSIVASACYIYLFYRKVVADDSAPA